LRTTGHTQVVNKTQSLEQSIVLGLGGFELMVAIGLRDDGGERKSIWLDMIETSHCRGAENVETHVP
jgi:hypothetical protein